MKIKRPDLTPSRIWAHARQLSRASMKSDTLTIVLLLVLPVLVRLPEILGFVDSNAIGYTGGLGSTAPGFIAGLPTIDPNIGFTSQALGTQVAHQWLSGRIPWWNPYEGVGVPLAGEMQSAAFFPLTLLLAFSWGQTVFHLALQMIGGIATYYLLRSLRLSRTASTTGAILFEFNAVFAWLANAVVNPVPFLPLLLLGIERAFLRTQSEATPSKQWRWSLNDITSGWKWIALALGMSLLAGFPEVAFIDGLLAALWVVVRMFALAGWDTRIRFALKLGIGFCIGIAIAAPPLIAFGDYLAVANIAGHAQNISFSTLNSVSLAQFVHPYIFGNIFQYAVTRDIEFSWGNIGGYLGATTAFLALMGLFGRRELTLRVTLGVWMALAIGRTFGVQPFVFILSKVPFMSVLAFYRYANTSWTMAAILLCAFAIDDWRGVRVDKIKAIVCAMVTLVIISLGSIWPVLPQLHPLFTNFAYMKRYIIGSVAIEWAAICFLLLIMLLSKPIRIDIQTSRLPKRSSFLSVFPAHYCAILMSVTVATLSIGYFFLPTLANPRNITIDYAGVQYLKSHAGFNRFYTLGPFAPNYGSYFDVASINHNDLPVSQVWVTYIQAHLDPYANPVLFLNIPRDPSVPSAPDELVSHLAAYEAIGVKFVVVPPGSQLFTQIPLDKRPTLVYQDAYMWIYQLPSPAPLFSAQGNTCQVYISSWTDATTTCASSSTLIYRTLTDAGWHASVNGKEEQITSYNSLFQQIALPSGTTHVVFWYEPKYGGIAVAVSAVATLMLFASLLLALWAKPRTSHTPANPSNTSSNA